MGKKDTVREHNPVVLKALELLAKESEGASEQREVAQPVVKEFPPIVKVVGKASIIGKRKNPFAKKPNTEEDPVIAKFRVFN